MCIILCAVAAYVVPTFLCHQLCFFICLMSFLCYFHPFVKILPKISLYSLKILGLLTYLLTFHHISALYKLLLIMFDISYTFNGGFLLYFNNYINMDHICTCFAYILGEIMLVNNFVYCITTCLQNAVLSWPFWGVGAFIVWAGLGYKCIIQLLLNLKPF